MKIFLALFIMAASAMSAYAQAGLDIPGLTKGRNAEEKPRRPEEKSTSSPLDRLPDKKFDPWGGVREAPKSKSK